MKQANEIIKHLFSASSDKLSKSRFFIQAMGLLPQNIADELLFCYIKDKTLFFVTKNRSMVFELNYKLKSLKEPLLYLAKHGGYEEYKSFEDIKVFATKYEMSAIAKSEPMILTYQENERSEGRFENLSSNQKLSELFEQIREMIKKTTASSQEAY